MAVQSSSTPARNRGDRTDRCRQVCLSHDKGKSFDSSSPNPPARPMPVFLRNVRRDGVLMVYLPLAGGEA